MTSIYKSTFTPVINSRRNSVSLVTAIPRSAATSSPNVQRPNTLRPARNQRIITANWAENRRSVQDITRQEGFEPTELAFALHKRNGPILVAYDGTPGAVSALTWTLRNMVYPGDSDERVEVVHVVCDPQAVTSHMGVGGRVRSPITWDASAAAAAKAYQARLQGQARDKVRAACCEALAKSGVPFQIHTPLLDEPRSAASIGAALMSTAHERGARALVLANHGPGVKADFGSVARYCYTHQEAPLLLVPQMALADSLPPYALAAAAGGRVVILVVSRLEELEAHWQWVVANCCKPRDKLHIWHINPPPVNTAGSGHLASLPTVLSQALRQHAGLSDVEYKPVYHSGGAQGVAEEVRAATANAPGSTMVVVMNYRRTSSVLETVEGGTVASHLTRTCPVPLLVLEPALT